MPTIIDVAALAGVSTATVSRVINDSGFVEPALKSKVKKAIIKLKYQPNLVARGLRSDSTSIIAVMISDIENPFYTAVCRGVQDVASEHGYAVMICNSDEDVEKESKYLGMFAGQRVAGVIISPASSKTTKTKMLEEKGIYIIALGRSLASTTDYVGVNGRLGAKMATRHLIESGAKRIACITGAADVTTANDRLAGYLDALAEAEIVPDKDLQFRGNFKVSSGSDGVEYLLGLAERPDAVFIANNQMTTGALHALANSRVGIPDNLMLVGFDDFPLADVHKPTITVVRQPTNEIGVAAANLLMSRINGDTTAIKSIILAPELIVRESSFKAKARNESRKGG